MKISKSKRQWAFIASLALPSHTLSLQLPSPPLSLQPPFRPDGAVLGNVDNLEGMSPRVVLKYLASCANVTGIEAPGPDCLFKNYVDEQFPGASWGNVCSPPDVNLANVTANLVVARSNCPVNDNEFLQTAVMIMKVMATVSCWNELCGQDDISLRIESQYIESCSDVELPYPAESDMAMFPTDDEMVAGVLTCMIDFVMDTPSSQFGLQDPPSPCYPPGYENMTAVCSSVLAPRAFAGCIDAYYFEFEEDDDVRMSFDYDMSIHNPGQDDDDEEDVDLFVQFCDILEGLTTGPGLACLDDICQDVTQYPSASPSSSTASPSDAGTTSPTGPPTALPTDAPPTGAPTTSPPGSPTSSPTGRPTAGPTGSPPTGAPTTSPPGPPTPSPTGRPTARPTGSPPTGAPTTSPPGPLTPSPTGRPTALPTGDSSPIDSPTASPTDSRTGVPTVPPTPWPTRSPPDSPPPTSAPSTTPSATAPTKSPRSSPTTPPSPFPSVLPSESPSVSPTLVIINEDVAQSSAAIVPTVSILGLSLLMGSLLIL